MRSVVVIAAVLLTSSSALAQTKYDAGAPWGELPQGRQWGSVSNTGVAPDGSLWAFERCGGTTCAGSNVAPVVHLSASGKYIASFGAGLFVFPHGLFVDGDGNVWVTDADGKDGKGHQVVKFSPDGK